MGKAPADQFYYGDFLRDTAELSLAATGAWIKCLCKMWFSVTRGRISMPMSGYARMFGSSVEQAKAVIDELITFGICDAETDGNANVTLTNRRMYREHLEREANKNRVAAYRERQKSSGDAGGNGTCNADVQKRNSASSSSSSTSRQKEVSYDTSKKPPPRGEPPLREIFIAKILTAVEKRLGVRKLPGRATWMQHVEWAFDNDFSEDIVLECFDLLSQQHWRDGPVKPEHITQHLPIMGKLRNEIEKQKSGNGTHQRQSERDRQADRTRRSKSREQELFEAGMAKRAEQARRGLSGGDHADDPPQLGTGQP